MKHNNIVNVEKMEINKPSELCQVLFFDESNKGLTVTISAMEIDLINYILYDVRKEIISKNLVFDAESSFKHVVELKEISSILGKYESGNFENIIKHLRNLRSKEVKINALGKNKDLVKTYTSFIHKVSVISNKYEKRQKVNLLLDGEIISMILNVKNYFSKMHLILQYSLQTKQSKLLYELLKDYEGIKTKTIEFELLLNLINSNSERNKKFAYFNNDILKKTIDEINLKTDINIKYEPIKEKENGERLQVTKIKFIIEKQSQSRLEELGLIQTTVTDNKFYNKSKSKLDKLVKGGYKVIDEEMWIEVDIRKNESKYESEMRIDEWLKETPINDRNNLFIEIAKSIDDCSDPSIIIIDYRIVGCFSQESLTKNPLETIELLNQTILDINQ